MVNIGSTLLYTFFGVFQIFIYKFQGIKGYYKKILTNNNIAHLSTMTFYIFIPMYSFLEISRVASMEKIKTYWILSVCTLITLVLRTLLTYLFSVILNFDRKIIEVFSVISSLSSLGSITLVLGKALCYSGCPLNDDPRCEDITGLMLVMFLIGSIYLFFFILYY